MLSAQTGAVHFASGGALGCVTVVGAGLRRQERRERSGTGEAVFESVRKSRGVFRSGKIKKSRNPCGFRTFVVGVSLKDLAKHSKINGLQAAS